MDDEPAVKVTLRDIYAQGQETQKRLSVVEQKVDDLTRVNMRLDTYSDRLDMLEDRTTVLEGRVPHDLSERITTLEAKQPLPWWQRLSVIATAVGLVATVITLVGILSKLGGI